MSIRYKILIVCGVTLVLVGLLSFNYHARSLDEAAHHEILSTARAFFAQIVVTRRWVAQHGGVYILKKTGVKTNPYLLEIPDLVVDITDTQGRVYTLRNPAIITREISELAEQIGIFKFHITSLKLKNPDNAPDDFEIEALQDFERGEKEAWRYEEDDNQRWFRYMAPLYVEESCLQCHGDLGYSVGDVRGGISVTLPDAAESGSARLTLALGWALGIVVTLGILYWALNITTIGPIERLRAASDSIASGNFDSAVSATTNDEIGDLARTFERMRLKVREYTQSLEAKVRQRTAELQEYSANLEEMVEQRTQELRDAQEQLVRREKLAVLGQMAGSVSHELRNPLAVINNAVYYLKMVQPDADETVKEYLDMLSAEVGNAKKIVSDLLDFARVKSVDREKVAVSELVSQVLAKHSLPENVTATTEVSPDLPPVYVDLRQIEQVIANLVTNAYQAMPDGGHLTINATAPSDQSLEISDRSSDSVQDQSPISTLQSPISTLQPLSLVYISFTDTGVGISPENIRKLFEPLFTTKASGIGMGLAICQNLVEANGGTIEVESEEGVGSTFILRLPL